MSKNVMSPDKLPAYFNSTDGWYKGKPAYAYTLCDKLTDAQKTKLLEHEEIRLITCHYRYAPELVYDVVVVLH